MFQIERQEQILEYINQAQKANTTELARKFNVSKVTIRRDIEALAASGLIVKTHGGAVATNTSLIHEIPYSYKAERNQSAKKSITVVTDDIKIAMELSGKSNVTVIVCGGTLSDPVYTLTGNVAVDFFSRLHVNKVFLGCDAVDLDFGISNRTYGEVYIKTAMIEAAGEIIMVTDNSKLDRKVFCHLCDISVIDKLIINQIDERNRRGFLEKGVEIITTDPIPVE